MGRKPPLRGPDAYVRGLVAANRNLLVPHYLIHSWLYYEADSPIVSDALFDELCKALDREWDRITHPHRDVIDRSCLNAGTGFYLQYPARVPGAATALQRMFHGR